MRSGAIADVASGDCAAGNALGSAGRQPAVLLYHLHMDGARRITLSVARQMLAGSSIPRKRVLAVLAGFQREFNCNCSHFASLLALTVCWLTGEWAVGLCKPTHKPTFSA